MIPSREDWLAALEARHGKETQARFSASAVAVCGLGGLGSHVAVALARAGVGRLLLLDFDRVDLTNLHRQQYRADQIGQYKTDALAENLRQIAPYLALETRTVRLDWDNAPGLLAEADIVCEAFDDPKAKAMLTDAVLTELPEAYLVAASGMAGFGSANDIRTRRVTGRFYLCGDGTSDVADGVGLVASRVMVCAAHQAHMILRILAGESQP